VTFGAPPGRDVRSTLAQQRTSSGDNGRSEKQVASIRRMAVYVDKVLKGANPGELSVERVTPYELIVNLNTARDIGITMPPEVLKRADSGLVRRESKCSKAGRPPWKFHAADFCQPIAGAHSPCGLSLRTNSAN
jgi:hypothetical protein